MLIKRQLTVLSLCFVGMFFGMQGRLAAQGPAQPSTNPQLAQMRERITDVIDDRIRVTRPGNRHPLARPEFESGVVAGDFPMNRMILVLQPDAEQKTALDALLAAQQNPASPLYQKWLTPEDFGRQFGVSDRDLSQVVNWLQGHGFTVDEISAGRASIVFSGTAGRVQSAFHTEIHSYQVNGQRHIANATDPEIPLALAGVVGGVLSLHDFQSAPLYTGLHSVPAPIPGYTTGGSHYLAPADFATIYDVAGLYSNSIDGRGVSIAVVGRSNFNLSDVQTFRSNFGLPANNPTVIVNGTDPGIVSQNEEVEAVLDVEWSGAVAKGATIKFVASASTASTDGVTLSAQYIVNHNVAPVMSLSFGLCEAALGAAGNSFWNNLWQQAAALGISVFVASGDSGAAGCDSPSSSSASHGLAVSGICSPPNSVCVGGTQFSDTTNPGLYWLPTNSAVSGSALSYIPEAVWNQSSTAGGSGLWGSGGGVSSIYSKPSWQSGPGVPSDGHRDVPDVSLNGSTHDGYLVVLNSQLYDVGGTSASVQVFAGLMVLVLQQSGVSQGNPNPILYTLATKQASGGAAVFHDITSGNNSVASCTGFFCFGQTSIGYSAGKGYDLATGLGSVDGLFLVNHWADGSATPSPNFQLTTSVNTLSVTAGSSSNMSASVAISGGFNSSVTLSASGMPSGVTASFLTNPLLAPGSGSSTATVSASSAAPTGPFTLTITAVGGGLTQTATVTVTVQPPPSLTLTANANSVSVPSGSSNTLGFSVTASGLTSPITFSATGLPQGMTYSFSPSSLSGSGATTMTLTVTAGSPQVSGTLINITATSGGLSKTVSVTAAITAAAPTFTIALSSSSATVNAGSSTQIQVTVAIANGFTSSIALAVSGLPSGVTASFSPATVSGPGTATSTLVLSANFFTSKTTANLVVSAVSGTLSQSAPLKLTVTSLF